MKIIERVFNATTGETTDIERNATADELAAYEIAQQRLEAKAQAEAEAKAKREALLARLGITEEEASLLAQSL